jgi:excinuclease UvrABC ATPase subunit
MKRSTPSSTKKFIALLKSRCPTKASKGVEHIDKIIDIDQSPIGRTPRSQIQVPIPVFLVISEALFANLARGKNKRL